MLKLHENPIEYKDMDDWSTCSWFCNRKWTTKVCTLRFLNENRSFTGIQIETNKDVDFEFLYQFHFIPNVFYQKNTVVRGIEEYKGRTENYCFLKSRTLSTKYCNLSKNYKHTRMNFQAVIFVLTEKKRRRFNFLDENVYCKSIKVLVEGKYLHVPIKITKSRAPILFQDLDENEMETVSEKDLRRFLQILYGARIVLLKEETTLFLKMSNQYKVLSVKKYCEQQLIWRDHLGFSEEEKFVLACEYNLNILMNQLLRNVKTVEELADLSSIAIRVKTVKPNIFKLLIAKMYRDF